MKLLAISASLILLAGCQRTSNDDAELAKLPAEVKLPECPVMWVREASHWKRRYTALPQYDDSVVVEMTGDCIEKWQASLKGKDGCAFVHGCPMYSRIAKNELVFVRQSLPSSGTVEIDWLHSSPTPGVRYLDESDFGPAIRVRKGD